MRWPARSALISTLPDSIRYLEGLTQVRYVFVYPEEKDLVIAGPAEEIDKGTPLRAVDFSAD